MVDACLSIAVLGSTGSVGEQSLAVVRENPSYFSVYALSAGRNIELLAKQIAEFHPSLVCVADEELRGQLLQLLKSSASERLPEVLCGDDGLSELVAAPELTAVVVGISGFAAFRPVISALEHGKHLALANKECLVAGGDFFLKAAARSSSLVIPVDSEHNSIFQCLARRGLDEPIRRIILTASGGPFFRNPLSELSEVTPEMAVRHPRWNMGARISVDSATLMNKALEVIEASVLFQLSSEKIEVLIHPESIVHGLVEYDDGTTLAALYEPDMRVPIAYAMKTLREHVFGASFLDQQKPVRSGNQWLDLAKKETLHFSQPDPERFPAIPLAYRAIDFGRGAGAVFNAADEVAVNAFLRQEIGFLDILPVVTATLHAYIDSEIPPLEISGIPEVNFVDSWGRKFASEQVAGLQGRTFRKESNIGVGRASDT